MTVVYVLIEGWYRDNPSITFVHGAFPTLDAAQGYANTLWPNHGSWYCQEDGCCSDADPRLYQQRWACQAGEYEDEFLHISETRIDPVTDL